ncbi:hypothetical protein ACI8AF_09815 [Blastococcus sp. SYSU D00669]
MSSRSPAAPALLAVAALLSACAPAGAAAVAAVDVSFERLTWADGVAVGPDGTVGVLLQGRYDSGLAQVRDGAVVQETFVDDTAHAVQALPDGSFLLVADDDSQSDLLLVVVPPAGTADADDPYETRPVDPDPALDDAQPVATALSPDGRTLYVAFTERDLDVGSLAQVLAVDVATGRVVAARTLGTATVRPVGVAASDDGGTVTVVLETADLTTQVWRLGPGLDGADAPDVEVDGYPVTPPAVGPDGELYLLTDPGAEGGPVLVRLAAGARTPVAIADLPGGPYDEPTALAVAGDGATVLVAARTGAGRLPTYALVDVAHGEVTEPEELGGRGTALAAAADGRTLFVAGAADDDGERRAQLWSVP